MKKNVKYLLTLITVFMATNLEAGWNKYKESTLSYFNSIYLVINKIGVVIRFVIIINATGILAICLMLNGCKHKTGEIKPARNKDTAMVILKDTFIHYNPIIKPIITKYCITCHINSNLLQIETYAEVKNSSDAGTLSERLFSDKDMPPSGSPKPTQDELNKIKKWIADGCKE